MQPVQPGLSSATALQKAQNAFLAALKLLFQILAQVFLPHITGAVGIFLLLAFVVYHVFTGRTDLPASAGTGIILLLLFFYGAFTFIYAVLTSCVFSIRVVSGKMEALMYDVFAALKEKIAAKIENMDEGIAKEQAKVVMRNSIAELFGSFKTYKLTSIPAAIAVLFLSFLTFVTKSVFIGKIMQMSGATISFSAIFASRATLIGAIFLNLRLLSTVLLIVLYGFAGVLVILNFLFVFAIK